MVNIKQVRSVWAGPIGTPYYTNIYFSDDADAATAASLVHSFWNAGAGDWQQQYGVTVDPTVLTLDAVTGAPQESESTPALSSVFGAKTSEVLPTQVQGLIRLTSTAYIAGRHVQGRVYVPAPCEDQSDAGRPNLGYLNILTAMCGVLTGAIGTAEQPVIWSRKNGVPVFLSGATAQNQWATLRSRSARG